jgi:hypothetical protein
MIRAFWDVGPCWLISSYQRFEGVQGLYRQGQAPCGSGQRQTMGSYDQNKDPSASIKHGEIQD